MRVRDVLTYAPGAAWPPRVLLGRSACGGPGPLEDLRRHGFSVLMAPAGSLLDEVDRGEVDVVLLCSDTRTSLDQLVALRGVSAVPAVILLEGCQAQAQWFLEAGADDCAFGIEDVGKRLRAVLCRREGREPTAPRCSGRFVVDVAQHLFTIAGSPVHLPPKEFGLLELLLRRDGRVVSREEALSLVWGTARGGDPTTVDVHVKRLRAKIEPDPANPRHLLTVRGLGYRFAP